MPLNDYRMLIYAIVLILVMLATNNPTLKSWLGAGKEQGYVLEERRPQQRRKEAAQISKMVPLPSDSIIPERDLDKTPVLEAKHLGIDFGGLTAVDDFNTDHQAEPRLPDSLAPTALERPRCSTCSPRSISPPAAPSCWTARTPAA